jgi:hypothetical protein
LAVLKWFRPVAAQRYPVKLPRKLEEIDSWIVGCPCKGGPVCEVRHRNWLVASMGAQPFAVLQIWGRHRPADPAVVVYGVMIPAAAGAVLALGAEATIRIGAEPPIRRRRELGTSATCWTGRRASLAFPAGRQS